MSTPSFTLPYALTIPKYYNGFDNILFIKNQVEINNNTFTFAHTADAIRNITVSGIENIERIELSGNQSVLWSFDNVEKVNEISVDTFQGLCVIPIIGMTFVNLSLYFKRRDDNIKTPIVIQWEDLFIPNERQIGGSFQKLGPLFVDFGNDLMIIKGGFIGFGYYSSREIIDKHLNIGFTIEGTVNKTTMSIQSITIGLNRKDDEKIASIFNELQMEDFYSHLINPRITGTFVKLPPPNSFYIEERNIIVFDVKYEYVDAIKEFLTRLSVETEGIKMEKCNTIDKEATTIARIKEVNKARDKFMDFFLKMGDPTPPKEYQCENVVKCFKNLHMFESS